MKKLKYYAFDVDDNILHLKTPIYIERERDGNRYIESITTMEYAKMRKNNDYKLLEDSFIHFSDVKNTFLDDVIYAIENKKFGPSWEEFINCIKNGHIFAIITARGHEPDTIKSAISYIIYNYLSTEEYDYMISNLENYYKLFNKTYTNIIDTYLNSCKYYGVMSNYFSQYLSEGNAKNPEEGKKIAIYMFVKYINRFKQKSNIDDISIGFSDDDKGNIDKIEKFFKNQLSIEFSQMKFNIYDTSNRDNTIHTKINY